MKFKFEKLDRIREPDRGVNRASSIVSSALVLIFGAAVGLFSNIVIYLGSNSTVWWQDILKDLEFDLVMQKLPFWFMLALTVSVCSSSPVKAVINELLFFIGVIIGAQSLPRIIEGAGKPENMGVWLTGMVIAVPLAFIFWYSKGRHWTNIVFDIIIVGVLGAMCFDCGLVYLHSADIILDCFNAVIIALVMIALATGVIQVLLTLIGGTLLAMILGTLF